MTQLASWLGLVLFLLAPLYFMLRFRWRGLLLSVFVMWLIFGILSEFLPLCRPGWEPLRHPFSFILGYVFYAAPYILIFGLKEIIAPAKPKNKPDGKRAS